MIVFLVCLLLLQGLAGESGHGFLWPRQEHKRAKRKTQDIGRPRFEIGPFILWALVRHVVQQRVKGRKMHFTSVGGTEKSQDKAHDTPIGDPSGLVYTLHKCLWAAAQKMGVWHGWLFFV